MELSPNEILDEVLIVLAKEVPPYDYTDIMMEYYGFEDVNMLDRLDLSEIPFSDILDKLAKDGYITITPVPDTGDMYNITFEGRVFIQNGGYVRRLENENAEREQTKRNANLTLLVAEGAAFAAFAFLFWDFIKYGLEHNWF